MSLLRFDRVTAGYDEIMVLDDVSFDLAPQKITTIIGPNGAGKSTLLRTVYGLTTVMRGRILVDDLDIIPLKPVERLAKGLVLVPQGRSNFPAMTAYENLLMATYTRHDRNVRRDIDATMERFPMLGAKRDLPAGNLSGASNRCSRWQWGCCFALGSCWWMSRRWGWRR